MFPAQEQDEQERQQQNHIEWLHPASQGLIAYGHKRDDGEWIQSFHKSPSLKKQTIHPIDSYISVNSFRSKSRIPSNVQELNALFVDIDFKLFNADPHYIYTETKRIIQAKAEIPPPSKIIFSGRGAHIYWRLTNATREDLPLWQACAETLINIFKDEADPVCKDAARVLRLPGTINSKNPTHYTETLEENIHTYTLHEFQATLERYTDQPIFKPPKPKGEATRANTSVTKHRGKLHKLRTLFNMHYSRIKDIETLVEMRKASGRLERGKRELTLWIYRVALEHFTSPQEAIQGTLELNKRFTYPLKQREAISDTTSARKKYKLTNAYIIRTLEISDDEQRHMSILITKEEKRRRWNEKREHKRRREGKPTRAEWIQQTKLQISDDEHERAHQMKQAGMSQKEIAHALGMSESTYKRMFGSGCASCIVENELI